MGGGQAWFVVSGDFHDQTLSLFADCGTDAGAPRPGAFFEQRIERGNGRTRLQRPEHGRRELPPVGNGDGHAVPRAHATGDEQPGDGAGAPVQLLVTETASLPRQRRPPGVRAGTGLQGARDAQGRKSSRRSRSHTAGGTRWRGV